MRHAVLKFGICVLPLALTPVWAFLIADGYLNFGGGEKDLLLLIPWLLWSFLYLVFFIISWLKHLPLKLGVIYSAGGATVMLGLIWLVMFVWFSGLLGVS
jgi:hypothetical protein